ncbi:MAG: hypothetical protein MK214_07340 [Thalassotalea sp.]|nr:hypothetical protein [Thalassotalea sp.]
MKIRSATLLILTLSSAITFNFSAAADQANVWNKANNAETKQRFIPVELFTGAQWDGKHELTMKEAQTTACYKVIIRDRPCDPVKLSGPMLTESNNTQTDWVGEQIPYYLRTFSIRGEKVESHFTINNSRDGMVRIFDKRKRWGTRLYDGLGSKFPLGYWKQGEVRTSPSKRPTRIEIIELNGPRQLRYFWMGCR